MNTAFYDFTQQTQGAIFGALFALRQQQGEPAPTPAHPLLAVQRGYAESPGWYMVQAAEFDPQPLTVALLRVRDIYASERLAQAIMDMMAAVGWFLRSPAGRYRLTDAGRDMMHQLLGRTRQPLTELGDSLPVDLAHLEAILRQRIDAWMADQTRSSWCLAHSRNRAPADDASPLVKINHCLSDINAYRDDAHMASFRNYGLDGYAWEAFSSIHAGLANNASGLFAQLCHRGYTLADYDAALADLRRRGWIEADDEQGSGRMRLTASGLEIRDAAEAATNAYFYAAWSSLDGAEQDALPTLLQQLHDACRAIATR